MVKFTLLILAVAGCVICAILRSRARKKADNFLAAGNTDEAVAQYKSLLDSGVSRFVNEEGEGSPAGLLNFLQGEGQGYIDRLAEVLAARDISVDTSSYQEIRRELEAFAQSKGVMNYRKLAVSASRPAFAGFHAKLKAYVAAIPST